MITHVVLFKLKDRGDESIAQAKSRLGSLAGQIPSLRSIEIGTDIIRSSRSYDLALIGRFDNLSGLEAYQAHPKHQPVTEYLRSVSESIIAGDFES
jgi:hypothetical protein